MSQNNQHTNDQATNDVKKEERRDFLIGGQRFDSPEAFLEFHERAAATAAAMRLRQEDGELRELIAEMTGTPGEVKDRVTAASKTLGERAKEFTKNAKDSYDSLTFNDVMYGAGVAVAGVAALWGAHKLYQHVTGGSDANLLEGEFTLL